MIKLSDKKSETIFQLLPHMNPPVRISPFVPREWEKILGSGAARHAKEGDPRFWLNTACDLKFCASGRDALLICLLDLNLRRGDEVLIVKTTEGLYISRCVTQTIERVCQWSQKLSRKTRLVLVIHEFGFPCSSSKILPYIRKGLPILEDCAYALGSRVEGALVGIFGDYALYSMPKYYPVPFGGLLVSRKKINPSAAVPGISSDMEKRIWKTVLNSGRYLKEWNLSRRQNWLFFADKISGSGFRPYWPLAKGVVPGVYVTRVSGNFKGETVKKRLNASGVESTQYYHQGGFYFPVHQFLTDYEKNYIVHHFKQGVSNKK